MWANKSGVQLTTIRKILIAWVLTLPMAILLGGLLFFLGVWISGE
jgi:PiT family inorganic phosphate transporter